MIGRKSCLGVNVLRIGLTLFLLFFPVLAQEEEDPNPDSPTPVLLSEADSTRALTQLPTMKTRRGNQLRLQTRAFSLDSQVVLYVTNIELLKAEEANAFRVFVEDSKGRKYRFPVLDLQPVNGFDGVYALTVKLRDEIGYWQPPDENGDVLVNVTWRGLTSNRVRLGLGKTGGEIKDDAGAVPTPISGVPYKTTSEPPTSEYVGYRWSGDRIRFLEQATFGPTVALDNRIRRIGLRTWLAEQFEAPYPSATNPYPNIPLMPTNISTNCQNNIPVNCIRDHYTMYPIQTWFYKEALYGEPQLRHRVAWALSQIWVISGVDTQQSSWMINYHQQLSKNAFGNWRQLMYDITLNPGMGNYLDMMRSTRNNPNENYPREILQLFNVGLFMLNQDGTLQLDGEGNPVPTYDQDTVNNFTLTFTGWTLCDIPGTQCPSRVLGSPNFIDPMIITNPNNHDLSAKTLLDYSGSNTTNIPACTGCTGAAITTYANNSLNQALDNIYNHPNVAPFVSRFLIQQLVTGDPTPAYVGRIAAVFNTNRTNPSQLKEVIRAILLDPEARGDVKTDPRYGKLREPVQFVTNIARHFDARSADRSALSDGVLTTETGAMGQTAFMSPSVFNFYPPDYIVPGTSFKGPEFALYTTGTAVTRANFGNTIIFNRININADRRVTSGTSINLAEMQAFAEADPSGNQLMDMLNLRMMHGTMSPAMRSTILNVVQTVPESNPLLRAQRAVYLVATSSQYQIQR